MKKVVMFTGGVETLEYFSIELGKKFSQMGYIVFYYDLKDEEASSKKLRKFIKPGETVMITFNFEGLEKEPGVYSEREGYIWQGYSIPCYNIVADHPYYYHDRLRELPEIYYHISIDRYQKEYFERYYKEYRSRGFLPLAGTALSKAKDGESEKTIKIIMTGNYTPPSFCEPYINWIDDEYAEFYRGIIDELLKKPWQTVEQVARRHCERELGAVPNEDLRGVFHKMIFIDLYVRNYWRGMTVKTLVDAGMTVDVIGKGWDELDCERPEHLRIHPQTDSAACLKAIQKAWISLNVMPWFKDGAHDRVFNSILNGAVCISDTSAYLCDELREGEGICYFELTELSSLPGKVKELLKNPKRMQEMVSCGREKVEKTHLWKHRAETLVGWFESDERNGCC